MSTINGNNETINVASGSSTTVTGNNDTVNVAANATNVSVGMSGSSDIINLDGGSGDTLTASNVTINLAGVNTGDTVSGSSDTINVNASGDSFSAADDTIVLAAGTKTTVSGAGDTFKAAAGAEVALVASGQGATITLNAGDGSSVTLNGSSGDSITATGDSITLGAGNTSATITGSGDTVSVTGTGDSFSVSGAVVDLSASTSTTITGNNDAISGAAGAAGISVSVSGSGDTVSLNGGAGDTVTANSLTIDLAANTTGLTITGSGDTVNVQGSGDNFKAQDDTIVLSTGTQSGTITGLGNTVEEAAGATGVLVGFSGNSVTADLNTNSASTVDVIAGNVDTVNSTGNTIVVAAGVTNLTINGSNNAVEVTGTGDSLTASNSDIYLSNGTSTTITGNNDVIFYTPGGGATYTISGSGDTVGLEGSSGQTYTASNTTFDLGNGNSNLTIKGSGDTVYVDGTPNSIIASNDTFWLAADTVTTITGSGDTILTVQGANDVTATVIGTGDTVTLNGGSGDLVTVSNNDVFLEAGTAAAVITGRGDTIEVAGTGVSFTASNDTVILETRTTTSIVSTDEVIESASGAVDVVATVTGSGDSISLNTDSASEIILNNTNLETVTTTENTIILESNNTNVTLKGAGGNVVEVVGTNNSFDDASTALNTYELDTAGGELGLTSTLVGEEILVGANNVDLNLTGTGYVVNEGAYTGGIATLETTGVSDTFNFTGTVEETIVSTRNTLIVDTTVDTTEVVLQGGGGNTVILEGAGVEIVDDSTAVNVFEVTQANEVVAISSTLVGEVVDLNARGIDLNLTGTGYIVNEGAYTGGIATLETTGVSDTFNFTGTVEETIVSTRNTLIVDTTVDTTEVVLQGGGGNTVILEGAGVEIVDDSTAVNVFEVTQANEVVAISSTLVGEVVDLNARGIDLNLTGTGYVVNEGAYTAGIATLETTGVSDTFNFTGTVEETIVSTDNTLIVDTTVDTTEVILQGGGGNTVILEGAGVEIVDDSTAVNVFEVTQANEVVAISSTLVGEAVDLNARGIDLNLTGTGYVVNEGAYTAGIATLETTGVSDTFNFTGTVEETIVSTDNTLIVDTTVDTTEVILQGGGGNTVILEGAGVEIVDDSTAVNVFEVTQANEVVAISSTLVGEVVDLNARGIDLNLTGTGYVVNEGAYTGGIATLETTGVSDTFNFTGTVEETIVSTRNTLIVDTTVDTTEVVLQGGGGNTVILEGAGVEIVDDSTAVNVFEVTQANEVVAISSTLVGEVVDLNARGIDLNLTGTGYIVNEGAYTGGIATLETTGVSDTFNFTGTVEETIVSTDNTLIVDTTVDTTEVILQGGGGNTVILEGAGVEIVDDSTAVNVFEVTQANEVVAISSTLVGEVVDLNARGIDLNLTGTGYVVNEGAYTGGIATLETTGVSDTFNFTGTVEETIVSTRNTLIVDTTVDTTEVILQGGGGNTVILEGAGVEIVDDSTAVNVFEVTQANEVVAISSTLVGEAVDLNARGIDLNLTGTGYVVNEGAYTAGIATLETTGVSDTFNFTGTVEETIVSTDNTLIVDTTVDTTEVILQGGGGNTVILEGAGVEIVDDSTAVNVFEVTQANEVVAISSTLVGEAVDLNARGIDLNLTGTGYVVNEGAYTAGIATLETTGVSDTFNFTGTVEETIVSTDNTLIVDTTVDTTEVILQGGGGNTVILEGAGVEIVDDSTAVNVFEVTQANEVVAISSTLVGEVVDLNARGIDLNLTGTGYVVNEGAYTGGIATLETTGVSDTFNFTGTVEETIVSTDNTLIVDTTVDTTEVILQGGGGNTLVLNGAGAVIVDDSTAANIIDINQANEVVSISGTAADREIIIGANDVDLNLTGGGYIIDEGAYTGGVITFESTAVSENFNFTGTLEETIVSTRNTLVVDTTVDTTEVLLQGAGGNTVVLNGVGVEIVDDSSAVNIVDINQVNEVVAVTTSLVGEEVLIGANGSNLNLTGAGYILDEGAYTGVVDFESVNVSENINLTSTVEETIVSTRNTLVVDTTVDTTEVVLQGAGGNTVVLNGVGVEIVDDSSAVNIVDINQVNEVVAVTTSLVGEEVLIGANGSNLNLTGAGYILDEGAYTGVVDFESVNVSENINLTSTVEETIVSTRNTLVVDTTVDSTEVVLQGAGGNTVVLNGVGVEIVDDSSAVNIIDVNQVNEVVAVTTSLVGEEVLIGANGSNLNLTGAGYILDEGAYTGVVDFESVSVSENINLTSTVEETIVSTSNTLVVDTTVDSTEVVLQGGGGNTVVLNGVGVEIVDDSSAVNIIDINQVNEVVAVTTSLVGEEVLIGANGSNLNLTGAGYILDEGAYTGVVDFESVNVSENINLTSTVEETIVSTRNTLVVDTTVDSTEVVLQGAGGNTVVLNGVGVEIVDDSSAVNIVDVNQVNEVVAVTTSLVGEEVLIGANGSNLNLTGAGYILDEGAYTGVVDFESVSVSENINLTSTVEETIVSTSNTLIVDTTVDSTEVVLQGAGGNTVVLNGVGVEIVDDSTAVNVVDINQVNEVVAVTTSLVGEEVLIGANGSNLNLTGAGYILDEGAYTGVVDFESVSVSENINLTSTVEETIVSTHNALVVDTTVDTTEVILQGGGANVVDLEGAGVEIVDSEIGDIFNVNQVNEVVSISSIVGGEEVRLEANGIDLTLNSPGNIVNVGAYSDGVVTFENTQYSEFLNFNGTVSETIVSTGDNLNLDTTVATTEVVLQGGGNGSVILNGAGAVIVDGSSAADIIDVNQVNEVVAVTTSLVGEEVLIGANGSNLNLTGAGYILDEGAYTGVVDFESVNVSENINLTSTVEETIVSTSNTLFVDTTVDTTEVLLQGAGGNTVVLNGVGAEIVDVSSAVDTYVVNDSNETVSISSAVAGEQVVLNGSDETISGSDLNITIASGSLNDVIEGSGNTITSSGTGVSFSVSNETIYLAADSQTTIYGNNDTIIAESGVNVEVTVVGSSDTLNFENGGPETITTSANVINLGFGTNATVIGDANLIVINGEQAAVTASDSTIELLSDTDSTLISTDNIIEIANGTTDVGATIYGDGDTVLLNNNNPNQIYFVDSTNESITAAGDNLYLYGDDSGLVLQGAGGNTVSFWGTGNSISDYSGTADTFQFLSNDSAGTITGAVGDEVLIQADSVSVNIVDGYRTGVIIQDSDLASVTFDATSTDYSVSVSDSNQVSVSGFETLVSVNNSTNVTITGDDNTVTLSAAYSSVTAVGSGDTFNLFEDNSSAEITAFDGIINVDGNDVTLLVEEAPDTIYLQGSGEQITVQDSGLTLSVGVGSDNDVLTSVSNVIQVASGVSGLDIIGAGNTVNVTGSLDQFTDTEDQVYLSSDTVTTITGYGDDIHWAAGATGVDLNLGGDNDYVFLNNDSTGAIVLNNTSGVNIVNADASESITLGSDNANVALLASGLVTVDILGTDNSVNPGDFGDTVVFQASGSEATVEAVSDTIDISLLDGATLNLSGDNNTINVESASGVALNFSDSSYDVLNLTGTSGLAITDSTSGDVFTISAESMNGSITATGDTITIGGAAASFEVLGGGGNTIDISGQNIGVNDSGSTSGDHFNFSVDNTTAVITGNSANVTVTSSDDAISINGNFSETLVSGDSGVQITLAGTLNDVVFVSTSGDTVTATSSIVNLVDDATGIVLQGGGGNDVYILGTNNSLNDTGSAAGDQIYFTAANGEASITGNNDTISAQAGMVGETLTLTGDNDTVSLNGGDTLSVDGNGSNITVGSADQVGLTGNDNSVNASAGQNVVVNISDGENLVSLDANSNSSVVIGGANTAAYEFVNATGDTITVNSAGTTVYIYGSGDTVNAQASDTIVYVNQLIQASAAFAPGGPTVGSLDVTQTHLNTVTLAASHA